MFRGIRRGSVAILCVLCLAVLGVAAPALQREAPASSAPASLSAGAQASVQEHGTVHAAAGSVWGDAAEYRAGEVLVQLDQGFSADGLKEQLRAQGQGSFFVSCADAAADGWAKVGLAPGVDVDAAIEQLQAVEHVSLAQPNFVYRVLEGESETQLAAGQLQTQADMTVTDDPYAVLNWAWMLAIAAPEAWELVHGDEPAQGQQPVTVGIMDTGCDVGHEDLAANIVACRNVVTDTADVEDEDGHGTHVAGIVSALPNNEKGVAGVSYNARIMPVKVFDEDDSASTEYLVKAYQYFMDQADDYNVRVVNVSLGTSGVYDPAVMRVADKAYHDYGMLSVFAAGNSFATATPPYYCFPCDFVEVGLGVINVYGTKLWSIIRRDGSSNYNMGNEKTKDVSAPGNYLWSSIPEGLADDEPYDMKSGTSMAAPVVSGVVALAWTANPDLTPGEMKSLISSTAKDVTYSSNGEVAGKGFDAYTAYGMVQADDAVAGARDSYLAGDDFVAVGKTVQLSVPDTQAGSWTWESRDPGIATVDDQGRVTGVSGGEAIICAVQGDVVLSRTVVVYKGSLTGDSVVPVGKTTTLKASVIPLSACEWTSSNPAVASVGKTSGVVRGLSLGTTVITARLTAAPNITYSKTVTVKRDITQARATLSKTRYTYNGKVRTPEVTSVTLNGETLVKGVDCLVSYDSGRKKAGVYKVTVKGTGAFAGSIVKTFKILKATNPLRAKARTKSVLADQLAYGAVKLSKVFRFPKAGKGAITYRKVASASAAPFKVGKKSGAITVAKGTARGSYTFKVKVKAAGTANYKSRVRTVTVKVKVV